MSPFLIGVDGGGTKTVAWLAQLAAGGGEVVFGKGHAGPGNPRAAGFEFAQANIEAAIAAAFADARLPRITVAAACLALAGAGRASEQKRIGAWARRRGLAAAVRVTTDAEPILASVSPENCGVVLICGTGSLVWGRNRAGETARCGGWGYLLGDEGSAYAIAVAALRAAVRAADGRSPPTALLALLQERLGAIDAPDLIEKVYHPDMTRQRTALLAEAVFDTAANDAVAGQIIENAAAELAESIALVARRLKLTSGDYPLALAGSVVLNQPAYRDLICSRLAETNAPPAAFQLVSEPVRGAVALARLAMMQA